MAGKVNTKFILIAGGTMALVIVGLMFVAMKMYARSAADHARRGDEAMAANDYREAVSSYSRAVNEDQQNTEYLKKWVDALEKWTPPTRQRYTDVYQQQYTLALNAYAAHAGTDLAPREKVLELNYQQVRLGAPNSLGAWENLARTTTELRDQAGEAPGADSLLKYRGIARASMLRLRETTAESFNEAADDLNKALAARPGDQELITALATVESSRAVSYERNEESAKAMETMTALRERLKAFTAEHKPAPDALFALFRVELAMQAAALRESGLRPTTKEILFEHTARLRELVDAIKQTPSDKLNIGTTLATMPYIIAAFDNGQALADEVVAHIAQGQETDAERQIILAKREVSQGKFDEAAARLQKVSELPDLPMSLKGLLLYDYRTEAVRQQAEAMLAAWDATKEAAQRTERAKKAREYRDALVKLTGPDNTALLLLDARLALTDNDVMTARRLLSQYSDRTASSDANAALLLGQLLQREGSLAGARQQYERVLEIDPSDVRAAALLGEACMRMGDFNAAALAFQRAAELRPDNETFRQQMEVCIKLRDQGGNDPVLGPLMIWDNLVRSVTPDLEEGERVLREALPGSNNDPRLLIALSQTLANKGDRAGALAIIGQAKNQYPDNALIKEMYDRLSSANPAQDWLDEVNKNENLTPVQKALAQYQFYINNGDAAKAKSALEEAIKLDPKDPVVVNAAFQQSLLDNDVEGAKRWAKAAQEVNADKADGATYQARVYLVEKKFNEAAATALGIVEKDKYNLLGWRILGASRLEEGRATEAIEAFDKALAVKADDSASIRGKMRALVGAGRVDEALTFARAQEDKAAADADFVDMWLQLEARVSGGNRGRAIEVREGLAAKFPENLNNKAALANLYMQERRFDDAQKVIDEIAAKAPGETAMRLKAALLVQQGKPAEAAALCRGFFEALPAEQKTPQAVVAVGQLLAQLGLVGEAIALLEENRSMQDPGMMRIERSVGEMYFGTNQLEKAAEAFERTLGSIKEDTDYVVTKQYAEVLLKLGRLDDAAKALAKMGEAGKRDGTALLLNAEIAAAQKKPDEARRLYDQAVAVLRDKPEASTAFYRRGEFSLSQGNVRDAEADFDQAAKLAGANAGNVRMRLVDVYLSRGDVDAAMERLRTNVRNNPADDTARMRLISLLLGRGEGGRAEALDLVDEAVEKFPESQEWMLTAADLMEQMGRREEMERFAKRAWEIAPTRGAAARYTQALLSKDRPEPAKAAAVLASPGLDVENDLALRMTRAWVLVKQGKVNEGVADLKGTMAILPQENREAVSTFTQELGKIFTTPADRAIAWEKIKPESGYTGWMRIALAGLELNDPARVDSAMADIEALATSTQDLEVRATAYRMLGTVAYSQKRFEDAVKWYRASVELNERDVEAMNNLAYALASDLNRPEEGLPHAKKAVEMSPQTAMFYDTLGTIQLALGQLKEAEESLAKAATLARGDMELAPTYLHSAEVKLAQNDKVAAQRMLEQLDEVLNRSRDLAGEYGPRAAALREKLGTE